MTKYKLQFKRCNFTVCVFLVLLRKLVSLVKVITSIEDVKLLRIILGSMRTEVGKDE